jgi:Flp pilus assembly secretin CpaC
MISFRKLTSTFFFLTLLGSCASNETKPANLLEVDSSPISVELYHAVTREFVVKEDIELVFTVENPSIATVNVGEGNFTVYGSAIGDTSLTIASSNGDVLANIDIDVIEPVIYLPVPSGSLYVKGIGKTVSVKGVITDSSVAGEAIWSVSDPEIVSFEAQGLLAIFTTLKRGNTLVTLTYGEHEASFMLYVTNIKGE